MTKKIRAYPCFFYPNTKHGFEVEAPDIPGSFGYGKTLEEAILDIKGSVEHILNDRAEVWQEPPEASSLKGCNDSSFVSYVLVELPELSGKMFKECGTTNCNDCIYEPECEQAEEYKKGA